MQFLFGMAMLELIVQGTMMMLRMNWWAAKYAWRLAVWSGRAAWSAMQDARWRWQRRRR